MPRKKRLVDRKEAAAILSAQLRRTDLKPGEVVKLTTALSRLQNWVRVSNGRIVGRDDEPRQASLDQQILEIERRRRTQ
jgi:hypothetical protein